VWNPATDGAIAQPYDARQLARRSANKVALQRQLGLAARADALLCGVVSSFTEQKGLQLVIAALPELLQRGGQLVVLGSGEPELEAAFRAAARAHPKAVAVRIGYDEALSHRVFAGTDVILVPSRFEPCGLTQMYGLGYGSLPLVHRVGGLADTVVDCALENLADGSATGFVFDRFDDASYGAALRRAFALQARRLEWRRVQRAAMHQVFDWGTAATRYLTLYRSLLHPTRDHATA
jgi:starch synthase